MNKGRLFVLMSALALTLFLLMSGHSVKAYDNVTYTLPFLGVSTNNVVYCFASNASTDNVSVGVSVMGTSGSTKPAQDVAMLGGVIIYAKQTQMITFTGSTATLGSAVADLSQNVGTNSSDMYGIHLTFFGSYTGVTTTARYSQITPIINNEDGNQLFNVANAFLCSPLPYIVFGPQTTTTMSKNGKPTVAASCLSVGLACYQGTTSPKRNLVGYTCMDTINTFIKPLSY
ncbi:MAG: hypothetical protein HQK88_00005 [Nitrospirae bacterium]|nr:hypothetical protein [Nitrospirota bacterium]MBF0535202.1 hypothetical protein [Nitrospirota bacterium]MBF0615179.1 hypothetical protein [Nitrospirota bacterium]